MKLRAVEPEDLDLLYQIENDQSLWLVGATNVPYSRYTLHDYIANSSDDIYADRQVRLMVENDEGETVGIVDLVQFSPQHLRMALRSFAFSLFSVADFDSFIKILISQYIILSILR